MKINKNLLNNYKNILFEATLPPPTPPEEPTVQDQATDEFMMSLSPNPGAGVDIPPFLKYIDAWQNMPAWLRGVKDEADFMRRYLERIPKELRGLFAGNEELFRMLAKLGILPENIIYVPMVVMINGRPQVRMIPFGRTLDGKMYLLNPHWQGYHPEGYNGMWPMDIHSLNRSNVFYGINEFIQDNYNGTGIHPGYYDPHYNWGDGGIHDYIRDMYGQTPGSQGMGYGPSSPFSIQPGSNQFNPVNPGQFPSWLRPLLIAPFLGVPSLFPDGSVGEQPQSPATAPYWMS